MSTGKDVDVHLSWEKLVKSPASPRLGPRRRNWRRWRAASSCRMCSAESVKEVDPVRLRMDLRRLTRRWDCCLGNVSRIFVEGTDRQVSPPVWSPCWSNYETMDQVRSEYSDVDQMSGQWGILGTNLTRESRWTGLRSLYLWQLLWSRIFSDHFLIVFCSVTTIQFGQRHLLPTRLTATLILLKGKVILIYNEN